MREGGKELALLDSSSLWGGLSVEGDRVLRDGVVLPCTLEGGTGRVHSAARHPSRATFFACERGEFVLSEGVRHVDPIEFRDGAPSGEPIGLVFEDSERLWIATRDSFGCVDTRLFYGRTFAAVDGVPAAPYLGLEEDSDPLARWTIRPDPKVFLGIPARKPAKLLSCRRNTRGRHAEKEPLSYTFAPVKA